MDYEYQILRHEKELAHLREMQQLLGDHQDTTDRRLDKIQEMLHDAAEALVSLTAQAATTRADLQTLGAHLDALIKALGRQHPNGQGES